MGSAALRSAVGFAVAAGVVLAGCGTTESLGGEEARAREAVAGYFQAIDRADGAAICERLTESVQRDIAELQSTSCDEAMADAARQLPGSFNDYRIGAVQVTGTQATVRLEATGFSDEIRLQQVGGEWRIAAAPGLGVSAVPSDGSGRP